MAEMTFRGNAGTEPGPGRGETTHRLAFVPGGADQAALMRTLLATAPTDRPWRAGRVEDAGPEIVACLVAATGTDPTDASDWLLAAIADFEMRVRITLELAAENNRGPDDQDYIAELSRRGWVHLTWIGSPGQETQSATVTETGRLVLAG